MLERRVPMSHPMLMLLVHVTSLVGAATSPTYSYFIVRFSVPLRFYWRRENSAEQLVVPLHFTFGFHFATSFSTHKTKPRPHILIISYPLSLSHNSQREGQVTTLAMPSITFTLFQSCCFFFLCLLSIPSSVSLFSGIETGDLEKRGDLFPQILRDEAVARLNELGEVSDASAYLERTFLSPASMRAINLISKWMEDAGLRTWVDLMGNVHGRVDGENADAEALLIGSHMDTVIDAGKFDGSLGIVSAISALKVLHISGKLQKLRRPVEVIAFCDEEGVRFQTTFLGSGAIAGTLPATILETSDKRNVSVKDVLKENSIEAIEESFLQLKYDPKSVWGYIELHIEQGPVLEQVGFPLGVVEGIAGQTRLKVTVRGSQGHAGTVPMSMRRDPMAAAAELIVAMESLCKNPEKHLSYDGHCSDSSVASLSSSLVCTVGEISTWPSASNVIPGQVTYTIDIRAIDDVGREIVIYNLSNKIYQICDKRSVSCLIEHKHDAGAVICDSELSSKLKSAAYSALKKMEGDIQDEVPTLMSGAGHDAMAMSRLTKVGMLFVRCRGGISHSPEEDVLDNDVWAAGLATLSFLENL